MGSIHFHRIENFFGINKVMRFTIPKNQHMVTEFSSTKLTRAPLR